MARMRKYGESKTTRIMIATVPHVTSGLGIRKFQADGFLLTRVYSGPLHISCFGVKLICYCASLLQYWASLQVIGYQCCPIFSSSSCKNIF